MQQICKRCMQAVHPRPPWTLPGRCLHTSTLTAMPCYLSCTMRCSNPEYRQQLAAARGRTCRQLAVGRPERLLRQGLPNQVGERDAVLPVSRYALQRVHAGEEAHFSAGVGAWGEHVAPCLPGEGSRQVVLPHS